MKKRTWPLAFFLLAPAVFAVDFDNGLSVSGGVKTGLLVKNSDFSGKLEGAAGQAEYKPTLFFRSYESGAYNGEGWFTLGYRGQNWGVSLGAWAHGDSEQWESAVQLGDHYVWANFYGDILRVVAGHGGGTPVTTGGWINADWLSYPGIRLFWVDPNLGLSAGVNFPDPGAEGLEPVSYFQTVMAGVKFEKPKFWVSGVFDNNLIYDDSEADYAGGLHRDPQKKPVGQSGNVAAGVGIQNFINDKGRVVLDGMVNNLGAEDTSRRGAATPYSISPVEFQIALLAGFAFLTDDALYTEIKAKYWSKQGENADDTAAANWGQIQIEPYVSYKIVEFLRAEISVNCTMFLDSYYLAAPKITVAGRTLEAGWAPPYKEAFDYYSTYTVKLKPALIFGIDTSVLAVGYEGVYSRDHLENTFYVDFRWSF
jgi:hypothetical protein